MTTWFALGGVAIVVAGFVAFWPWPRRRRSTGPNSVAALRARENADHLPKYPTPGEWRER